LVAGAILACAWVSACGGEPEQSQAAESAAVNEPAAVTAAPARPVAAAAPRPEEVRVAAASAAAGGGTGRIVPPEAVLEPPPDWSRFPGSLVPGPAGIYSMKIDESGNVTDVRVERSGNPEMDAAIVAALQKWRYKPATRDGKPIAVYYTQAFRFHPR
jgi:periplasmic protein TonB